MRCAAPEPLMLPLWLLLVAAHVLVLKRTAHVQCVGWLPCKWEAMGFYEYPAFITRLSKYKEFCSNYQKCSSLTTNIAQYNHYFRRLATFVSFNQVELICLTHFSVDIPYQTRHRSVSGWLWHGSNICLILVDNCIFTNRTFVLSYITEHVVTTHVFHIVKILTKL